MMMSIGRAAVFLREGEAEGSVIESYEREIKTRIISKYVPPPCGAATDLHYLVSAKSPIERRFHM